METPNQSDPGAKPGNSGVAREITRRQCVSTLGRAAGVMAFGAPAIEETVKLSQAAVLGPAIPLTLSVNGASHSLTIDPRVTLLDLLRERLSLTGTKKGCDHGQCGACTVLVNGRRINSCLSLAVSHDGDQITTIEGLARGEALHRVQSAFIEHDGLQCGYCTPGQICSAVGLLSEAQRGDASFATENLAHLRPIELTAEEIRERMSGNICRCGAYPGIVAAVKASQEAMMHASRTKVGSR